MFAAVDVLGLVGDRLWGILLLEASPWSLMTVGAAVYGLVDVLPFIPRLGDAPGPARRAPGQGAPRRPRAAGAP